MTPARVTNVARFEIFAGGAPVVADDPELAWSLARGLAHPRVTETRGLDAIHVHAVGWTGARWVYWSDERVTNLPDNWGRYAVAPPQGLPAALSADAVQLISLVMGSDSGPPAPGWGVLAAVDAVTDRKVIREGAPRRGGFQRAKIEELRVRSADGTDSPLYLVTDGYSEGYRCEVSATEDGAHHAFAAMEAP